MKVLAKGIRGKTLLSSAMYIIPFLVTLGLVVNTAQTNIDFAKKEIAGAKAIEMLLDIQINLDASSRLPSAEESQKVIAFLRENATLLSLDDESLKARKKSDLSLNNLKEDYSKSIAEARSHNRALIDYIGNSSNLILDPDLDSYYVMDIVLIMIPTFVDRIHNLAENKFSKEISESTIYVFQNVDIPRLQADIDTALIEDKFFYGENKILQTQLPKARDGLLKISKDIISKLNAANVGSGSNQLEAEIRKDLELLHEVSHHSNEALRSTISNRIDSLESQRNLSLGIGLFAMFLATTASLFLFERSVKKPIESISENINRISAELDNSMAQVKEMASQISQSSVSNASALEETMASLTLVMNTSKKTKDDAHDALTITDSTFKSAQSGQNEMSSLVTAVDTIENTSSKVSNILTVIEDIAFQTNLLALNASVEAARAGEQGKGFAVVAEAVRTLAQHSASASKEISELIKESNESSRRGSQLAHSTSQVFNSILTQVSTVRESSERIEHSVVESSHGIEQINSALSLIDNNTQSFAAMSEELTASNESLAQQSKVLHKLSNDLNTIIKGAA